MNLTEQQELAASAKDGSTVVIACPGSGKTLVATERIKRLIADGQTWDSHVAVTFTKRAAGELLARVGGKLGYCGTIHGLAHEILKRSTRLPGGMAPDFAVWDDEERLARVRSLVAYHRFKTSPERFCEIMDDRHAMAFRRVLKRGEAADAMQFEPLYEGLKRGVNAEDWNGLIDRARAVLTANPDFLRELQDRWRHVTVDEYQDVDRAQDDLISILWPLRSFRPGERTRSLFVVGDPMQAIYGWRGGEPWLLEERSRISDVSLRLDFNFRSGAAICEALNDALLCQTMGGFIESRAGHEERGSVEAFPVPDQVAEQLLVLAAPDAVLCRTNEQVERAALAFGASGVKCRELSGNDDDTYSGAIAVGTIHLAKGLEWDTVVLPGWTEGLFPSQQAIEAEAKGDKEPMEAERRLAYVAVSRARRNVVILSPRRFLRGPWDRQGAEGAPSRFIREMGLELVGEER